MTAGGQKGQRPRTRALGPAVPMDGVPFITRWSGEDDTSPLVTRRDGRGIGYADERSFDRVDGLLWMRTPSQPGRGKPEYGKVHSLRQRLAMLGQRCQICGGAADRSAEGVLWLVDARPDELRFGEERTPHPPVCAPCARRSVHVCPHLRKTWVALRVRSYRMWGVNGALYRPSRPTPVAVDAGTYPFDHPNMPWILAGQLIAELGDFTVTEL